MLVLRAARTHRQVHAWLKAYTPTYIHTTLKKKGDEKAWLLGVGPLIGQLLREWPFAEGPTGLDKSDLGAICVWVGAASLGWDPREERRGEEKECKRGQEQEEKEEKKRWEDRLCKRQKVKGRRKASGGEKQES